MAHSLAATITVLAATSALPSVQAAEFLVRDQAEYKSAVANAAAGDVVRLADGEWRDFEIVFTGIGKPGEPITLTAQTKGKVVVTGRSNLRLAGEHLIVSGLVFRNGYTPTNEVISFRRTREHLAHHSRVTEVVIDRFNNPERFETDFWVVMHGKRNRFDHSYLAGKSNSGVTMAVRLDAQASQRNEHRIDHNYFGYRPVLGANGGETLRIGTSKYSLVESRTVVESNYFERCDGEVEIISSKSGGNVFRGNVFVESRGTLTLRHGNGNLVEGNVFLGNGVAHTGGIRVINKRQTVRNNYLSGLSGRRFGAALVVMNGVPNSPINRYHQVERAVIENNTIIDAAHIELAAGSDDERSAVPIASHMRRNLIVNSTPRSTITAHDDITGVKFEGNVVSGVTSVPAANGFTEQSVDLAQTPNGLKRPLGSQFEKVGAAADLAVVAREETGPPWYPKPNTISSFGTGRTFAAQPGQDTLTQALATTDAGDAVELQAGEYVVTKIIELAHPVTVRAAADAERPPVVRFERSTLFELADGGSVEIIGVAIDGGFAPDAYGNSVIRTSRYAMLHNYAVRVVDSEVANLNTNHSFNFLRVARHTFAQEIEILRSSFKAVSGAVIALNREIDDLGIYNGEYITIEDSRFLDIGGAVLNVYRGGTDESTFGPHVTLHRNTLANVGLDKRNASEASVFLHGAQEVSIADNEFRASERVRIVKTVGEPITILERNRLIDTAAPVVRQRHL